MEQFFLWDFECSFYLCQKTLSIWSRCLEFTVSFHFYWHTRCPSGACRGFYRLVCFSNSNEKLSQHSCNFLFWCIICFFHPSFINPSHLSGFYQSTWSIIKRSHLDACIAKLLTMFKWKEAVDPGRFLLPIFSFYAGRVFSLPLVVSVNISPLLPKAHCFLSFALWVALEFYFLLYKLLWSSTKYLCSLGTL